MNAGNVELVYFDGCPHVEEARNNLRNATEGRAWREWNLSSMDTPERLRRYGSPTVLVGGRDVTGAGSNRAGITCRLDGVPSVKTIREELARLR